MESFFRYIAYVDYYKGEEKIKNVGFLRWKIYKDIHFIEIQVKDVDNLKGNYEIIEKNTNKILDEIMLDKGIGNFIGKYPSTSISGEMYIDTKENMLCLCDVKGFVVQLDEDKYLSVDVKVEIEKKESTDLKSEEKSLYEAEDKDDRIEIVKEDVQFVEEKNNKDIEVSKSKIKIMEPLYEDKWKQLCKDYPKVHPFPDKKTFLSIKPKDFVILQQEYQKLVHNSFLLHGFYNYGHMILGKLSEERTSPIYIGVPGVYYEREKQAAQMFGFVGFESTEDPVQSGSYGYYMMEVKI